MLDQQSKVWQQYTVRSAVLKYKTSAAVTTAGHIYAGVDYDTQNLSTSLQDVAALSPVCDGPIWENLEMAIDPRLAMTKPIMSTNNEDSDDTAFCLSVYSTADTASVLWCKYIVDFTSPNRNTDESGSGAILSQAEIAADTANVQTGVASTDSIDAEHPTGLELNPEGTEFASTHIVPDANPGDELHVSSLNNHPSVNGNFAITLSDKATGQPVPQDVYTKRQSNSNGIFSWIINFVKPYLRPFVLGAVDTLLPPGANGGTPSEAQPITHVVSTTAVDSFTVTESKVRPLDSVVFYGHKVGTQAWTSFALSALKMFGTYTSMSFATTGLTPLYKGQTYLLVFETDSDTTSTITEVEPTKFRSRLIISENPSSSKQSKYLLTVLQDIGAVVTQIMTLQQGSTTSGGHIIASAYALADGYVPEGSVNTLKIALKRLAKP